MRVENGKWKVGRDARSDVAQKHDLQKPSPMEKVPRNEADEEI